MNDVAPQCPPRAGSLACSIFGRDDELRHVTTFVETIARGPATLAIVGEAGIGKTTLWEYGIACARDAGHRLLTIRASADEEHNAGAGLIDLCERDSSDDSTSSSSATPSFDLGRALVRTLRRMAAAAPVVLAVDDQHWLDAVTANAVRFTLNRLIDEPIGLLLTSSSAPDRGIAPISPRDGQRVELGPLRVEALRQVLVRSLGTISKPDLSRAHELSNGNPRLALKLVRSWRHERQGGARLEHHGAIEQQLLGLPDDAIRLVRTLAVAGPVPAGVIAGAAGLDDFTAAAAAAIDAGIVHVTDDLSMRFTQPHYSSAIAAATNPLDRSAIHGRLVDAVTTPESRARHLALATVLPDEAVAQEIELIAERFAHRGLFDRAAELVAHSVRLTPPSLPDVAAQRRSLEVAFRAASGETARAVVLADRLLADLGPGRRRAEVLTQRVFLDFGDSERFLRQALDDVESDLSLRARILDLLGWQLGLYRGRLPEGIARSTEALALSREIADAETTALAAAALATTSVLHGVPRDDLLAEAVEQGAAVRLSPLGRWPSVFQARTLLWAGRLDEAHAIFLRMQKHAVVVGSEFQRPYRLHDLAVVSVASGDLGEALSRAEEGIEAARDADNEQAIVWLAHPCGLAAALQGNEQTARWAAQLLDDWGVTNDEAPRQTMAEEVLGNLAATQGEWPTALRHFEAMVGQLDAMGYAHPGARPALPRAIEAATMVGDSERCRALTQQLAAQAAPLSAPLVDAQVHAANGQLALLDGESDRAIEYLEVAVSELARLGYRFDTARVRLPLARALLRSGLRSRAQACAELARDTFAAASAPAWAAAADALLTRAGGAAASGSLTRTELQIATMVATGRTNREIAGELFISTSTVEAHLTRIYRKLAVRGRTELTSWMHARA